MAFNRKTLPINLKLGGGAPIGAILFYSAGSTTLASMTDDWTLCNGAELNKFLYPELFEVIGYAYGGSGNKFNIPHLTDGKFIRCDPTPGQIFEDCLPNITGWFRTEAQLGGSTGNEWYGGAFTGVSAGNSHLECPVGGKNRTGYKFDASWSCPTYGKLKRDYHVEDNTHVIPYSIGLVPLIRIK